MPSPIPMALPPLPPTPSTLPPSTTHLSVLVNNSPSAAPKKTTTSPSPKNSSSPATSMPMATTSPSPRSASPMTPSAHSPVTHKMGGSSVPILTGTAPLSSTTPSPTDRQTTTAPSTSATPSRSLLLMMLRSLTRTTLSPSSMAQKTTTLSLPHRSFLQASLIPNRGN